jgi:CRP-like cAMP-binding protein
MSIYETLSKMRMFKNVPESELKELIEQCEPSSYAMGAVVCHQGESATHAMVLLEGKLDVSVRSETHIRSVGTIHPGEIFGEQGLFHTKGVRNATVLAGRPSQCLKLTPKIMKTHSNNKAMVALEQHLIATMARRIRATNLQIQKAWKEENTNKNNDVAVNAPKEEQKTSLLGRLRSLFGG